MPKYSKKSKDKLSTAHEDLQTLFNEVIKDFDCTVLYGYRSPNLQRNLYMKGRGFNDKGEIVITDRSKVVTYLDGYTKKSNHNVYPSLAVDAIPYLRERPHIQWDNVETMRYFGGFVMGVASRLLREGKINSRIRYGGDWDMDKNVSDETFVDAVHFEILDNE